MNREATGVGRLLWSLAIGLLLTVGLLLAFYLRLPAEAQVVSTGIATTPTDHPVLRRRMLQEGPAAPESTAGSSRSRRLFEPRLGRGGPRAAGPPPGLPPALAAPGGTSPGQSWTNAPWAGGVAAAAPEGSIPRAAAASPGHLFVDLAYDVVWGYAAPGETITVHRADGAYGAAEADGVGFFWTPIWHADGRPADVDGGGSLEVFVNGTLDATVDPLPITGQIEVLNDRVVGTVDGVGSGEVVTVTLGAWAYQRSFLGAPWTTATTDASGAFVATFPASDVGTYHYARVAVRASSATLVGYLYPRHVFQVDTFDYILGYAEPGQSVTATVIRGGVPLTTETAAAGTPHGMYGVRAQIEPGDVVEVNLGGGTVISTTAHNLTARVDAAADRVTGSCPPSKTVHVWTKNWNLGTYAETTVTADPSGAYTATFPGHDIRIGDSVYPLFSDDAGHEVLLSTTPPGFTAFPEDDGAAGSGDAPNVPYTFTLYHAPDTYVETGITGLGYNSTGWVDFEADVAPGDVVTLETPTWIGTMTVANLDVSFDVEGDRVLGDVDVPGQVMAWAEQWMGWQYPVRGISAVSVSAAAPFDATFPRFDVRDGCHTTVHHYDADGFGTRISSQLPHFAVDVPWGVVVDPTPAGDVLTATLYESDGTTVKHQIVREDLAFWGGIWLEFDGDIAAGDWLTLTNGVDWIRGMQVPTLTLQANRETELVWGQGPEALLLMEHDDGGSWDGRFVPGGHYALDWSFFGRDLQKGDWVNATYQTRDGNLVWRSMEWFRMRVNYGHEWVEGNLEPGHTLWLTVTESDGSTIKATAELQSQAIPWWDGRTGFSTDLGDPWMPERPDIQPDDRVYLSVDDGRSTSARVGTIDGALDIEADTLSGTVHAPWFTETLDGWCGVWEESGPGTGFQIDPDGGSFFCDFGAMGWDLQPEQDVGVHYREPDGDELYNVFRQAAPHLGVEKWAEGSPAEGGNFAFQIEYWNDGDAPAEDVVVTDTLEGMTYLFDTSPFAVMTETIPGRERVVWHLGTVPPNSSARFDLFVRVTAVQSDTIVNAVEIATSDPYDQGGPEEKTSQWSGHVEPNDTHLNVGKWSSTDDPAAGHDFVSVLNVCNQGATASSELVITDTLHPSTTLQSWWAEHAGWVETYNDPHTLILARPSVPGGWCGQVYVRVQVDSAAGVGVPVTNTVVIAADNDLETEDNEAGWEGYVGEPRRNLHIEKKMEWARPVPNGEIGYSIDYSNWGNVLEENVLLTDVLPANTRFSDSWIWVADGEIPVTPMEVTDDYVVWDAGSLVAGTNVNMGVRVTIDGDATPGDTLTNTATISPQPDEERYFDNVSIWTERIYGAGPNLRVSKYHWWESEDRIRYGIWVRNVGTTRMEGIWITDTYPVSTTSNGDLWVGHGPWITHTHNAAQRQYRIWVEQLGSGDTAHVGFWVDLDESIVGQQGLVFTNTVEAPWPDDIDPADNTDVASASTGPDVFVHKWLSGGEPRPGEIVTFTVEFGNQNQWPWDGDGAYGSHITDTLPPEMSFVRASAPWDADWTPDVLPGNVFEWAWGAMSSDSRWRFELAARITETVEGGDVIVNVIEAYGDSPSDVEPSTLNNVFTLPITILNPRFEVGKIYESSQVAGSVVTYTLTVTNVGTEDATGVVVTDALPAGLTYGEGDGTFDGSDVTWTFDSLAVGGTASGWFSAALPDEVGQTIVNDDYGVRASDQGVSGPTGEAVSFTVEAGAVYLPLVLKE